MTEASAPEPLRPPFESHPTARAATQIANTPSTCGLPPMSHAPGSGPSFEDFDRDPSSARTHAVCIGRAARGAGKSQTLLRTTNPRRPVCATYRFQTLGERGTRSQIFNGVDCLLTLVWA